MYKLLKKHLVKKLRARNLTSILLRPSSVKHRGPSYYSPSRILEYSNGLAAAANNSMNNAFKLRLAGFIG